MTGDILVFGISPEKLLESDVTVFLVGSEYFLHSYSAFLLYSVFLTIQIKLIFNLKSEVQK